MAAFEAEKKMKVDSLREKLAALDKVQQQTEALMKQRDEVIIPFQ